MIKIEENGFNYDDMFYDITDLDNLFDLQKELLQKEKIYFTLPECINIWQKYSWSVSASWLFFPKENKVEEIKSCYRGFVSFEELSNG